MTRWTKTSTTHCGCPTTELCGHRAPTKQTHHAGDRCHWLKKDLISHNTGSCGPDTTGEAIFPPPTTGVPPEVGFRRQESWFWQSSQGDRKYIPNRRLFQSPLASYLILPDTTLSTPNKGWPSSGCHECQWRQTDFADTALKDTPPPYAETVMFNFAFMTIHKNMTMMFLTGNSAPSESQHCNITTFS